MYSACSLCKTWVCLCLRRLFFCLIFSKCWLQLFWLLSTLSTSKWLSLPSPPPHSAPLVAASHAVSLPVHLAPGGPFLICSPKQSPHGGPTLAVAGGLKHRNIAVVVQACLTLQPHGLQHARLPCPSPPPGACSNSCPLTSWCHSTVSSSVIRFSFCLQSFLS